MAHHLSPRDVVPPLREDLRAGPPTPSGAGAEVITVAPHEGGAMRMHGFEFQVARMLDGRRTAEDVIVNCRRLGLPVNLDALEDFLYQLKTHGLLGDRPLGDRPGSTWSGSVRDLYRNALKAVREGEFDRARVYLDTILTEAPGTIEAVRLRDWIDSHPDPHVAGRTFGEVFRRTLDAWADDRPKHLGAELRDSVRRSAWPIVAVLTALGFLIAYALLPNNHRVNTSAQVAAASPVALAAPVAGTIDEVMVKEGDRVEAGAPLFSYGGAELQAALSDLTVKLDAARAPLRQQLADTPEGQAVKAAEDALARAQSELLREQQEAAGASPGETTRGAQEQYAAALDALNTARAQLDLKIPADAEGAAEIQTMTKEMQVLTDQIQSQTVKAPSAGVVTKLFVRPGQTVTEGQSAIQLEDLSRLRMVATIAPKHAKVAQVGTPIRVKIGQDRIDTKIEAVSGNEIAFEIPNPDGKLRPGTVKVAIDIPPSTRSDAPRS